MINKIEKVAKRIPPIDMQQSDQEVVELFFSDLQLMFDTTILRDYNRAEADEN